MTSRTPLVQQRQPQRTLSGPGLSQRPPHQRSLSQTYLPSPPTRSEGVGSSEPLQFPATDPPVVGDGGASSRHGGETLPPPPSASSKRSGSKLKLELLSSSGNDDLGLVQALMSESPLALDSATSRPFTPSRIMGPGGNGNGGGGGSSGGPAGYYGQDGGSDMGDMSPYHGGLGFPRIPAAATGETNSLPPLPMPPRRPQRPAVPPTPRREVAVGPTPPQLKKDGRPKPYVLDVPPDAPRYAPLGGRLLGGGSGGGELTNMDPPRLGGMRAGATGSGRNSGGDGAGVSKSQPARYADFFPWTGTHPEDQFSENVIRHGYFDKAPAVPQGESTSARPTMAAALKSKPSLLGLGSLLTAIMAQRRQNGQITATSTFKPPPRVTLTDAKREAWLHDLANPSFSLRRLSRTIPHGIRGKVLLEQCLAKNVPTDRAVWLAKCVGANEIRAFKRKGLNGALVLGGEAKWVRDWTVSVEQFVEAVVTKFTEPDWKTKTHYALRLATHIYSEQLLDRDHYMDWLLSCLESSSYARLPMWILVVQIYWKDILSLRKYGRRLAVCLLSHQQGIQNDADRNSLVPLSLTLTALIKKLMLRYRESFIYPSAWMRYRDSLAAQFAQDEEVQPVFQFINSRNERLVRASKASASASRQALVRMLDQALLFPSRVNLAAQVWESSRDKEAVVRALLEWSTSLYRPGATKIYVAARLLRHWAVSHGLDVTWALLRFVESETLDSLGRKQLFYHLASELTRSGHFSVAGYVQWLISRGGIVDDSETDVDGPCGTRLLVELPLHALDESLLALRRSMLRRTSFPVNAEREDVAMAIRHLKHRLGLPLDPGDPLPGRRPLSTSKLARLIESSGRTLKSEIGFWIRGLFVTPPGSSSSSSRSAEKASAAKDKGSIGQMDVSTTVFDAVRTWLIAAQDYSMLADVLKAVAAGSDPDVLASVADTVNLDVETYLAIGAAADLFTALEARRKALYERSQQDDSGSVAIRPLVASLVSLGARLPGQAAATARLRQELARIDRNAALNPCSPISDNMQQVSSAGGGAAADASDERLAEEIEKLLANGNVLDPRTMERLAAQLVGLIETNWLQMRNVERLRTHAALLTRVRIHDPPSFDRIVTDWMASLRDNSKRAPLTTLLPFLVVCGCLTLPIILSTVPQQASQPRRHTSMSPRATYLQEVLQLIVMPPTAAYPALSSEEVFRYSIMQRVVQAEHARAVASLLRGALHEHCAMSVAEFRPYSLVLASDDTRRRLLSLLRVLVLADGPGVCQALSAPPQWEPRAGKLINDLTSRLVREGDMALGGDDDDVLSFDQIFESTTDFSLPFCQLKLAVTLAVEEEPAPSADAMVVDGVGAPAELQPSNMELFARAMDRAIEKRKNTAWTAMLSALGPDVVQHINAGATSRFLSLVPSLKGHTEAVAAGSWDPEATLATAAALLSVVEASTRNANGGSGAPAPPPSPSRATSFATSPQYPPSSHTVQMTAALGDKLQDIWEIVASADADADLKSAVLDRWLPLLLSFIIVHCPPAPLPSVASSGSSAANGSGGASSTTAANNMTTPGGPSSATTPAASHQASTPTAAGLAPPSSSSAERAAGESRGRLLVSLAGLLLDLDNQPAARIRSRPQSMLLQSPTAVPPPARQANAQPINDDVAMTPSQTALPPPPASSAADLMPPPPPPSLLLASAASCRLSSLVYDVALVLVDSLDDSLRAQCVRALGGAQGSAASDARIRYIFSIPVPPTSSGGSGLLLATRDRSAVVNNTAAAAGAPMMAMTTAAAVGSPQGSSGGSGTASQHGQEQAQGQGQGQSQVQSQVQGQVQTQIQGQGQVQSQGQGGQQQQVQFTTVSPAAAASAATAWLSIMAAERRAMMGGGAGGNPTLSAASAFASINGAPAFPEKLVPFVPRRWEILSEPTPNIGENDTSLSLTLFDAIKNRTGTSAM